MCEVSLEHVTRAPELPDRHPDIPVAGQAAPLVLPPVLDATSHS